jgi:hypothetical protein
MEGFYRQNFAPATFLSALEMRQSKKRLGQNGKLVLNKRL